MLRSPLVAALAAAWLAAPTTAQRGRPRAEEIVNRVGVFFTDTEAPAVDGDKVADLATCPLAHEAAQADQLTVLYLYDGSQDEVARTRFERELFGDDELGIALRCFRCGRIDLAKTPAMLARFGKQAPLFVAIDEDGKTADPVSMAGNKADRGGLRRALDKAAAGALKPPLATFVKDYAKLVGDLEQALRDQQDAEARQGKAGADKAKRSAADHDRATATAAAQKLLDKERELLGKLRLPERPAGAQRLGGWNRGKGGAKAGKPDDKGGGDSPGTGGAGVSSPAGGAAGKPGGSTGG